MLWGWWQETPETMQGRATQAILSLPRGRPLTAQQTAELCAGVPQLLQALCENLNAKLDANENLDWCWAVRKLSCPARVARSQVVARTVHNTLNILNPNGQDMEPSERGTKRTSAERVPEKWLQRFPGIENLVAWPRWLITAHPFLWKLQNPSVTWSRLLRDFDYVFFCATRATR